MELICIPPDLVAAAWPVLGQIVKRAYDKTRLGLFSATEREILNGKHLLWCIREHNEILAAAVTFLINTDDGKVCEIVAGGKSHSAWAQWAMSELEKFAAAEGCSKMRIVGRRGWSRALPDFTTRFVIHEKELKA